MLPLLALLALEPGLDAHVRLTGDACPEATLVERVRGQVGDIDELAPLEADGNLRRRDDGQWQLDLEIARGDGEPTVRSFVAPECATAIDAAALVIALAMDPAQAEPERTPAVIDVPTPAGGPAPAQAAPRRANTTPSVAPTPPATPRHPKVRGLLRAGGGVDFGGLPGAAAFFEAAGGALGPRWRAELTGMYRLQSADRARLDRDVGGRFVLWTIGARGCGVPSVRIASGGVFSFPLCAGAEGGRLVVEGFGFAGARTTRRPWAAATIGPGVAWAPLPNIAISLQAALGIPWIRSAIAIDGLERLHVTGSVFGRAWLGIEGRFP